ncbi:DUF5131 family protein [Aureimonas sp. AU40]|uniref:DUF5131 family protein n=1 Tax=Aureimonas sp. AU40 TaxID=1637747 RepID=UPI000AAD980F|nr:phage Gp37/Gp68 family protein [Aureimonas sp. AU40]
MMAEVSAIEWCDSTFNPWIGCTKISSACDNCYAETLMDKRYGRVEWGPHGARIRTSPANWALPRRWQRQADAFQKEHGRRQRVFCASLADVFDNQAPEGAREDLWALIRECPDLDWLLLTKRPQNIAKMLPAFWGDVRRSVWLGISTENQEELERRSRAVRDVFAERFYPAVLFASAEPLLSPLDLRKSALTFDWIIAGGESGSGARPMSIQWVRELRDQCAEAGVAFLFKQWGEWAPPARFIPSGKPGRFAFGDYDFDRTTMHQVDAYPRQIDLFGARSRMERVGKKAAGRNLDGQTHDGFPTGAA